MYKNRLKKIEQLRLFNYSKFCNPVPHRIIIFTKNKSDSLRKFLNKEGIGVRPLFMPMHRQPIYNFKKKFKNSEILFSTGICLPSAPTLKKKELGFICNKIKKFFN
jgi:perosamine synthetase